MTLTEFLVARIAEDEAVAADEQAELQAESFGSGGLQSGLVRVLVNGIPGTLIDHSRVLAECQAKRRIIEGVYETVMMGISGLGPITLRMLALPYADHPDYDSSWSVT